MKSTYISYPSIIIVHVILGILVFISPSLSIIYGLGIFVLSFIIILKTQNKNNEVLYLAAYAVGSEVLLRMTGGTFLHETTKYSVILYMLVGMYYSGWSRNALPYWIFIILLIPGLVIASFALNLDTNIRKAIAFNLSGPICLGISSLYCYQRSITLKELDNIMLSMLGPIISTVAYLFLHTPSVKDVVTSTQSNFETSGGFGPNQVSTIIGLGAFLAFTRLLFYSKSKGIIVLNFILLFVLTFRGIVTFSRGGMICAAVMCVVFLIVLFFVIKRSSKIKLLWIVISSLITFFTVWGYSSSQTGGLIDKRYANQDAAGRVKSSLLTGREEIMEGEIKMFYDNVFFGAGVGKAKENRLDFTGETVASHNEITRMLAEHGTLGILALLILIITPLAFYINNKQHIYLLSFLIFWLLTINHAAIRLAAPAFVYALSLLHIYTVKPPQKKAQDTITVES